MKASLSFKRKYFLCIVACYFASTDCVKSQTFTILPSNTLSTTLNCDSNMQASVVYISNLTLNDLHLSYTILSNTLETNCWVYQFCDWEKCKLGLPRGTNTPDAAIPAHTENNYLMLDAITQNFKGQGSLVLRLFETTNPSNSQTITWNITGCATGEECAVVGITESVSERVITLYPVPAANTITIGMKNRMLVNSIKVFSVLGQNVMNQVINSYLDNYELAISSLESGVYFMQVNTDNGTVTKRFVRE